MISSFGLALLAFVAGAVALWEINRLKTHLRVNDQISTKKWRRAANGVRYQVPLRKDVYPSGSNPSQVAFFEATSNFALKLNEIYSDGPWSFDDEGKLDLQELNGVRRSIVIRHGQQKTGAIELSSINYESKVLSKHLVTAKLEMINARFWPFYDVYGIAITVAGLVADEDKYNEAKYSAAVAALDCMWMIGPEAFGNPVFEVSVTGSGLALFKLQ